MTSCPVRIHALPDLGEWHFVFFLLCRGRVRPELFSPSLVLISSNGSLILHQLRPDVHAITYKCVATGRPARDELWPARRPTPSSCCSRIPCLRRPVMRWGDASDCIRGERGHNHWQFYRAKRMVNWCKYFPPEGHSLFISSVGAASDEGYYQCEAP